MITADSKDWTWVLDRACPDCGFDTRTLTPDDIPSLVRSNAGVWRQLLDDGAIHSTRPNDRTWSPLEYACHVRDVYRRYDGRVALMLDEDDPLFPNWDQDATAVEDRYNEQDAATVVTELEAAAEAIVARLESVPAPAWARPGRRSDGASFTLASIARYMVHDPIHHVWDVTNASAGISKA